MKYKTPTKLNTKKIYLDMKFFIESLFPSNKRTKHLKNVSFV